MSHFYGGIEGNRGPATRQGSKDSGINAYAQGYHSRITVSYHHNDHKDCDSASVTFSGGYTTYYRSRSLSFSDIDLVVEALDCGDPKINKMWEQVRATFDKIEAEAPKAIKRQREAREREARKQRKQEREKAKRLAALRETITHTERHYYATLVAGMDERDRIEYMPDDKIDDSIVDPRINPEPHRNEDGHLIVGQRAGGTWGRLAMFDLTAGEEVEREEVEV